MAKFRYDFVTNSSSSSFIIKNNTDSEMTSAEVVRALMENVIKDAEGRFTLAPYSSITYECGDHSGDGAFENFIHDTFSGWGSDVFWSDKVCVDIEECHH